MFKKPSFWINCVGYAILYGVGYSLGMETWSWEQGLLFLGGLILSLSYIANER